jgi:hypothetical protein
MARCHSFHIIICSVLRLYSVQVRDTLSWRRETDRQSETGFIRALGPFQLHVNIKRGLEKDAVHIQSQRPATFVSPPVHCPPAPQTLHFSAPDHLLSFRQLITSTPYRKHTPFSNPIQPLLQKLLHRLPAIPSSPLSKHPTPSV